MPPAIQRKSLKQAETAKTAYVDLPLERFITYGLLRLTNRLNRQAMRILDQAAGLRLPEWRCMAFICSGTGISLNDIAERTGMDRGLITRSVQGLVMKGIVRVERDTKDRRIVFCVGTETGHELYRRVLPTMQARQARLLSSLSEADQISIYRILDQLNGCLDGWPESDAA